VREQARPGDIVVCLGAGTISAWANALPARLSDLEKRVVSG
jgi:UDP-N-acetylmuramate--alanine ligase